MKVSVIISVCDNRYSMLERSLDTWSNQTLPKSDFELVIIDDSNREDIEELCKNRSIKDTLQIQYINIDNKRSIMPVKTFIPVISNNVGFKMSLGEVVVITGPETLQSERNLEFAYTMKDRKQCAYGLVYRSNLEFMKAIEDSWKDLYNCNFTNLLNVRGAKAECRTRPPHPPAYWYLMAVAKKHVYNINGIDERFAAGICAEDDDFANRMELSGVQPVFEHKMVGIHQDHSREDLNSPAHAFRKTPEGVRLRERNVALMKETVSKGKYMANILSPDDKNYDPKYTWGDLRVVTKHNYYNHGESK